MKPRFSKMQKYRMKKEFIDRLNLIRNIKLNEWQTAIDHWRDE